MAVKQEWSLETVAFTRKVHCFHFVQIFRFTSIEIVFYFTIKIFQYYNDTAHAH